MNIYVVLVIISIFELCYSTQHGSEDSCGGCLLLSPYIKEGHVIEARKLSQIVPAPLKGLQSYSGFINVNEKYNSNQFFWFFPAEKMETTPWIIWLGGGPGISAMKGLFDVMGPLFIEDGQVKLRNITWASDYSLLFLDVPVGAGFSFTDFDEGYPDNEDDIGSQMLVFLLQFLQVFPELQKAPLFITGQSYAGKYVPAFAIQIHRHMLTNPIHLRGIAIGNGIIDPRNMMKYSQLCTTLGILDEQEIKALRNLEEATVRLTDAGRMVDAANKFNETIEYIKTRSGVNIYNFFEDQPSNQAPAFEDFLNNEKTRELIHVGNVSFHYNSQKVYSKMLPDFMNSTKPFVEELLEHYGVMSYSGQLDIILAYSLSQNAYKTLQWSRVSEYKNAPRKRILDDEGKITAYSKSGGNFVDVLIRNAGHSAAADQPEVTKNLIDHFINEFK